MGSCFNCSRIYSIACDRNVGKVGPHLDQVSLFPVVELRTTVYLYVIFRQHRETTERRNDGNRY